MEATPEMRQQATRERHRRETRREIWLPAVFGLVVLVVAVLAAAFVSNRYEELSLISNFVLTLLILCPAALCFFPLALVLVVAAVGMNSVHSWSEVKLDSVNRMAYGFNRRVDGLMTRLGRAGVDIGAATAPLEQKVFSAFDRPSETASREVNNEPDPKRPSIPPTAASRPSELAE